MSNSKIWMVMDATSDLGRAIALELARVAETVILVARDEGQGTRVQNEIVSVTQNPNLDLQLCDLGILSSVRNLGTIVSNRYERLDVLIHNVAVYTRHRETTVDGYKRMFATNYLGPFLLTNTLLDPMRASGAARIVNVTAPVTHPLNFDDLQSERQFNSISAFNAAWMAVLLSTFALARRRRNDSGSLVSSLANCRWQNVNHPSTTHTSVMLTQQDENRFVPGGRKSAVLFKSCTIGKTKINEADMNPIIDVLLKRRSVRAYEKREIDTDTKAEILKATLRAPTAGNLMLYSILDITDQTIKDRLAVTCDNQPFIARAPMVWIFLADYQRWFDYFLACGVDDFCERRNLAMQKPEESDLFLASCDALIAAQNAVIAAESFGIGSCYIGDIMEQYEVHRELLDLPPYTFPICMLVFGYPTPQQQEREYTPRFDSQFIFFENRYRRLAQAEFDEMFAERQGRLLKIKSMQEQGIANVGQATYLNKFSAEFSHEMRRSVRVMLEHWKNN